MGVGLLSGLVQVVAQLEQLVLVLLSDARVLRLEVVERLADNIEFVDLTCN